MEPSNLFVSKPVSNPTIQTSIIENIEIDESKFILFGGSTKGFAKKVKIGNYWYKISAGAFNAQAEAVASRLAAYTNLGDHVEYEICKVNGEYATKSKDFVGTHEFYTVKTLYLKATGNPIEDLLMTVSGRDLFYIVSKLVSRMLGIDLSCTNHINKLSLLLQFDALVLNEDRHFGNIKFINYETGWGLAPAFDFDCSLYSCVEDLSTIGNYVRLSQPFYATHDEQLPFAYGISPVRLEVRPFKAADLVAGVWEDSHSIGLREVIEYLEKVGEIYGLKV